MPEANRNSWSQTKGPVTRCNFSCSLQCNSTLERCKIGKYKSQSQFANIFLSYQTLSQIYILRVEMHCKLQEKLHHVTGPKQVLFIVVVIQAMWASLNHTELTAIIVATVPAKNSCLMCLLVGTSDRMNMKCILVKYILLEWKFCPVFSFVSHSGLSS